MTHPIHPFPSHKLQLMGTPHSREKEIRELCTWGISWTYSGCCKMRSASPWFLLFRSPFCSRQLSTGLAEHCWPPRSSWRPELDRTCCPKSRPGLGGFVVSDPAPTECSSSPGQRYQRGTDFHGMFGNQPNQDPTSTLPLHSKTTMT